MGRITSSTFMVFGGGRSDGLEEIANCQGKILFKELWIHRLSPRMFNLPVYIIPKEFLGIKHQV
jgi:hypothetical protein